MKKALLSVSNKEGILELAKFLISKDVEIISTGGTAKLLSEHKIKSTPITEVTGNPEAFGGRMKTISFQVGSALLYRRDNPQDINDARDLSIEPIDLVVCNLYPFQEVSQKTQELDILIENIDIGGPTMIRAAAKNYKSVSILSNPNQYSNYIENFDKINEKLNFEYAKAAFTMTAEYDQFIINTLGTNEQLPIASTQERQLRYGENPHQKAWVIPWKNAQKSSTGEKLQGKELSYNNMIDMDAAWKCTSELNELYPGKFITTIIKHANPCGVSLSNDSLTSLKEAWSCDPVSSFGSIISFNALVTEDMAKWLSDKFIELVIAPKFSPEALQLFAQKKNIRLIRTPNNPSNSMEKTVKSINGALLIQDEDEFHNYEFLPTTTQSIPEKYNELKNFGMIVNKYIKSNAITLVACKDSSMVIAGAGMGQPNRLDSLKMLAGPRALNLGFKMSNVLLISDAFFPFRDSIDIAAEMGIKYIIQPGGSIRDKEVIQACNESQIAMEFTHTRHFRH